MLKTIKDPLRHFPLAIFPYLQTGQLANEPQKSLIFVIFGLKSLIYPNHPRDFGDF